MRDELHGRRASFLWQLKLLGKFHFCPLAERICPACDSHAKLWCAIYLLSWRESRLWHPDMASHGHDKKILLELAKQPDNSRCADCGAPGKRRVCGPTCWFSRWTRSCQSIWSYRGSKIGPLPPLILQSTWRVVQLYTTNCDFSLISKIPKWALKSPLWCRLTA